jgi:hypothetical protein
MDAWPYDTFLLGEHEAMDVLYRPVRGYDRERSEGAAPHRGKRAERP